MRSGSLIESLRLELGHTQLPEIEAYLVGRLLERGVVARVSEVTAFMLNA
jgi:hypothetical protein